MSDYAMQLYQLVTSLAALTAAGIGHAYAVAAEALTGDRVIAWSYEITGGPPATIQVDLQGSLDGIVWYTLDTSAVVGNTLRFVALKPVRFLRLNLVSIGAGGGAVLGRIYCA